MARKLIALVLARLESSLESFKTGRACLPSIAEMPDIVRRPETWWALAGVLLVAWVVMLLERRG